MEGSDKAEIAFDKAYTRAKTTELECYLLQLVQKAKKKTKQTHVAKYTSDFANCTKKNWRDYVRKELLSLVDE